MNAHGDILGYTPLVLWVCRQYGDTAVARDDLVQEGLLGVLDAMRHYQHDRGAQFDTYAVFWIRKRVLALLEGERRQSPQNTIPLEHVPPEQMAWQKPASDDWFENIVLRTPRRLSKEEISVLRMVYKEEKTIAEIVKELGLSRTRVMTLKQRALRNLRNKYK
jgi:RNA polymerase sigma factor (sigma-70 family)